VRSFKDFVGAAGHGQRDGDAERLGGLEVQEQFNFGGLLHRQVGRILALEDAPFEDALTLAGSPDPRNDRVCITSLCPRQFL
jgi:hypothetical protein